MDVGTIANLQSGINAYSSISNANTTKKTDTAANQEDQQTKSTDVGEAYSVEISDEAKEAQKSKGLTDDQIQYLKDSITMNQQTMLNMMIQALTDNNDKLQGWLDEGVGILNFDGVQIDASRFGLPEVATNPEDAEKAVADDGDWGVDAVATRIFDLASEIAGNDPEKLETMRAAVEEGFSQAGIAWNNATGLDKMPDITEKTYNEIMSRFDKRAEELGGIA
jgi:TolA-binding protein